jgi:copper chaperone
VTKATIKIGGMSCEHCVKAVTNAVRALPGVGKVAVSLQANTADVEYDMDKISLAAIKSAIAEEGYDAP